MSTVKRAEEGMQKIGTVGKEELHYDPASRVLAIQRTDDPTGQPRPVTDPAEAARYLKAIGYTPAELLRCSVRLLGDAAEAVRIGKQFVAHLPPDKVPSEIDRAIVGERATEAGQLYKLACATDPTGPFLEQIESLDLSLDVLAYANEPTVNRPVAQKEQPAGQKRN